MTTSSALMARMTEMSSHQQFQVLCYFIYSTSGQRMSGKSLVSFKLLFVS